MGILCLLSVAGAQGANVARKKRPLPPVDVSKLVWPQPPQVVRIRYVTQLTGELDVRGEKAKKPGWLEKAAGVSLSQGELPTLRKPYGAAVDSKGRIYVADEAQHVVFVFDQENKKLTFLGDKPSAPLQLPMGVAVDDKDRVFVTDAGETPCDHLLRCQWRPRICVSSIGIYFAPLAWQWITTFGEFMSPTTRAGNRNLRPRHV